MLRVSSETVKTLAVCWKKSAVSCILVTNLTAEIVQSDFVLRAIVGRLYQTPASALDVSQKRPTRPQITNH
jgi:hypothetical protein